jgi:hypothetical protein
MPLLTSEAPPRSIRVAPRASSLKSDLWTFQEIAGYCAISRGSRPDRLPGLAAACGHWLAGDVVTVRPVARE